jgi:hypothetical protein
MVRRLDTTAGRAVLQCDRGAAPMDAKDVNLWHGKLCENWMNHQRGRKEEKRVPFTGDGLL